MAFISPLWMALSLFVLWCIYPYFTNFFSGGKFRKFAEKNGCKPVVNASADNKLPWNLGLIYFDIKTIIEGKDILTEAMVPRFKKWGNSIGFYKYGRSEFVFTNEPEIVKTVLATKFADYGIADDRLPFRRVLGASIFTTDGSQWEHARAMFRPQFTRELINDFESSERACAALFEAVDGANGLGAGQWTETFDIMPMFYRFTLDTTSEFLFGANPETQRVALLAARGDVSMAAQAEEGKKFSDAVAAGQDWILWRMRFGPSLYWMCELPRYRRALKTVHDYVGKYVDQALELQKGGAVNEKAHTGEKERYSLLKVIAQETQDKNELRDQLLSLLLAGRDTTSVLLSWLFLLLAMYPAELEKLRRAILQDIGPESEAHVLDFAKLKSCRYLQYCLNETLRLFPPVAANGRVALRDTVLPIGGGPDGKSPVAIRKGSGVGFCVHAMHMREDLWGPDAVEFKPERWNGRKLDWSYLPFNGGPRVCLGQQYALIEASYLVVRCLQRYDGIELGTSPKGYKPTPVGADGTWGITKTFGLVQYPTEGVHIRLRRATAA